MGERKFSEELEIKLDDIGVNIVNLESILENIKKIDNETELKNCTEYYFRLVSVRNNDNDTELEKATEYFNISKNYNRVNLVQLRTIINALNDKKDMIMNESTQERIEDKIERIKSDNEVLKDISIISTLKEDNDKIDGFRKDVTYLEFDDNGNKEFYEIENVDIVNRILSDFDIIKGKNKYEIMNIIRQYCKKCDVIKVETTRSEVPTDNYNKERVQISNSEVKSVIDDNENTVLKERVDFKKFVNEYKNAQDIKYALNSNGERIYMIDNEKYKYIGEDRELTKLSEDGKDENDINISSFNSEIKGKGNLPEINLDDFKYVRDFIGYEELITYIMNAMEYNMGISDKQNDFLASFISKCMECNAVEIPLPVELSSLYERFMKNIGEDRLKVMITKTSELEQKKKEDIHELKLVLPKDNKLSNWEKAGFISVAVILESALVLAGIFAILAIVKK